VGVIGGGGGLLLAASTVCGVGFAVAGWLYARTGADPFQRRWWAAAKAPKVQLLVAAAGAVALVVSPAVTGVLWLAVALNHLLGRHEAVPFSTYPMFSQPSGKAVSLRFEDSSGELIRPRDLGFQIVSARKRFDTEQRAAKQAGLDDDAARKQAAEVIASWVEDGRPAEGPLAREPVRIVVVDHRFDGTALRSTSTLLCVTTPR
jgi:hypothetical protein